MVKNKNAKIHVEDEKYVLFVNNRTKNGKEFPSNYYRTSKYNLITFLPVNLFEQFRRIANLFFLIMTGIQLIPGVSPYAIEVNIIPLVIILGLTAIKDGYEDWRRHKEDKITNSALYSVLLPKDGGGGVEYKVLSSGELKVGDIVELHDGEAFPADLVVLSSSEENGLVFIDTASLDGETNHKKRQAPKALYEKYKDDNEFKGLESIIECDVPDDQLNIFHGVMKFTDPNEAELSLDVINFLPRGAILRNTSKAYATIVYTGENTKLSRNQKEPKFKFSRIERLMNKFVPVIFAIQVVLALLGGGLARLYDDTWIQLGWSTGYSNIKNYFFDSCTFFILFSYLIPMSLYVGLEFSRLLQALFIAWDLDMFVEGEGGCLTKTSNLNDELGQIEFIFSDKTGTLTENLMLFRSCSIGADLFDESRINNIRNQTADIVMPINSDITQYFLFCLSLCHEVSPEIKNDKINYRSESPDELALMEACELLKCPLKQRLENKMVVQYLDKNIEFDLLHLLQFNSDRKRMCVIVRKLDSNKIYVFSKGADSAIFALSSKTFGMDCIYQDDNEYQNILNKTNEYLTLFSQKGYRTLLYSGKEIGEDDYQNWKVKLTEAENSLKDREQLIDSVFKEIEQGMYIIGCTAVEDKLQDNLQETLSSFLAAGIQFAVATGDKLETAVNIGYNCGLLTNKMKLLYMKGDNEDSLKESISNLLDTIKNYPNETYALIVVGDQCDICLKSFIDDFSLLFSKCATAICCRMTPLQKSKMVKLVREKMKKCCLGVGDGANDVSMILEANVGVGVFGKEGRQAVNNSDYAIRKFHHLKKLLFVHGRWNYLKCAFLVYFAFYNNLSFSIPQFLIGIFSGFTGCNMYPSAVLSVYNILFSGPIFMAFGLFYEDVSMKSLMDNPECYKRLITDTRFFSYRNYFFWLFLSISQGLLSFFVPYLTYSYSDDVLTSKSFNTGFYVFGLVVISINIWGNFFISSICVSRWNFLNSFLIFISIPLFYIVMFISAAMDGVNLSTIAKNFQISLIWLIIIIGCIIGIIIKYSQLNFLKLFAPSDIDIIKEIEYVKDKNETVREYIVKESQK